MRAWSPCMYIDARMRGVRSLEYADKLNIGDSKAQKECRACMRDWGRVALRRADALLDHIPGLQLADRIRPGPECIGMRMLSNISCPCGILIYVSSRCFRIDAQTYARVQPRPSSKRAEHTVAALHCAATLDSDTPF